MYIFIHIYHFISYYVITKRKGMMKSLWVDLIQDAAISLALTDGEKTVFLVIDLTDLIDSIDLTDSTDSIGSIDSIDLIEKTDIFTVIVSITEAEEVAASKIKKLLHHFMIG